MIFFKKNYARPSPVVKRKSTFILTFRPLKFSLFSVISRHESQVQCCSPGDPYSQGPGARRAHGKSKASRSGRYFYDGVSRPFFDFVPSSFRPFAVFHGRVIFYSIGRQLEPTTETPKRVVIIGDP